MENKLIIGVGGRCGTGKSSILYLLKQFLKEHGFEVEYKPTEFSDFETEEAFDNHHGPRNNMVVEALKNKTKIELKEIQFKHIIKTNG